MICLSRARRSNVGFHVLVLSVLILRQEVELFANSQMDTACCCEPRNLRFITVYPAHHVRWNRLVVAVSLHTFSVLVAEKWKLKGKSVSPNCFCREQVFFCLNI